jgi:hypothetical protein
VAEGLADRLALLLESRADLPVLLERLRRLAGADLREPRAPVGDQAAAGAVGEREPLLALPCRRLRVLVVAALLLGLPLAEIADVGEAVLVEVRPVVQHHDDVRPRARLDGRGDARLQVVGVDRLERDLDLRLLAVLGVLPAQLDVPLGDEVDPLQHLDLGALRVGGGAPGREDALEARERGGTARGLQQGAPVDGMSGPIVGTGFGHVWASSAGSPTGSHALRDGDQRGSEQSLRTGG